MRNNAILAIDDDPISLRLMRVLLTRDGYDVRTATDACEAATLLGVFQPRLILGDIDFLGTSGIKLMRRLKENPTTAGVPVIAVTTARAEARAAALAAGCDGYVAKPFAPGALLGAVSRQLERVP